MIRLSETIAKANYVEDVTPNFVREAYGLLRQSIISVEKDDIEVDEEEDEVMDPALIGGANRRDGDRDSPMADGDAPHHSDGGGDYDGNAGGGAARGVTTAGRASRTPVPSRRKTKIEYDKYMSIFNLLVLQINLDEAQNAEEVEHEELVVWYLEEKEDELNTQEELKAEKELVSKVLKRMVKVCSFSLRIALYPNLLSLSDFSLYLVQTREYVGQILSTY